MGPWSPPIREIKLLPALLFAPDRRIMDESHAAKRGRNNQLSVTLSSQLVHLDDPANLAWLPDQIYVSALLGRLSLRRHRGGKARSSLSSRTLGTLGTLGSHG